MEAPASRERQEKEKVHRLKREPQAVIVDRTVYKKVQKNIQFVKIFKSLIGFQINIKNNFYISITNLFKIEFKKNALIIQQKHHIPRNKFNKTCSFLC